MPRILLVGMMGAGKTTTGRALAARLGWDHLDSDEQVQATTGRTVPEIFESEGEPAFRVHETEALRQAASTTAPVVVSVAGGAVLDPGNRRILREAGTVVWLRVPVAELAERVGGGDGRPLLRDDPAQVLAALYERRRPLYEEVAHVVVDVADQPVDVVVDHILAVAAPA